MYTRGHWFLCYSDFGGTMQLCQFISKFSKACLLYFYDSFVAFYYLITCRILWSIYHFFSLVKLIGVFDIFQSPVTPLQRAAEVPPPMFNQILMNQQQEDSDGPPQKKIPTLLTWTLGGRNIYVEGSWDKWTSKYSQTEIYMSSILSYASETYQ